MKNFAMKFWKVVNLVFVIPKTYHSLNMEFLYESYTWGSEKGVIVIENEGRIFEDS